MGTRTAYQCDGPGCEVLATKAAGTRFPSQWLRVSVRQHDPEIFATGAFHAPPCATAWLEHVAKVPELAPPA